MKWNKFLRRNLSEKELLSKPYVNYKKLKQIQKQCKDSCTLFEDTLNKELDRVCQYLNEEQKKDCLDCETLHKLHQYSALNVASVEKIVKKWKKHHPDLPLLTESTRIQTRLDQMKKCMTQFTNQICIINVNQQNNAQYFRDRSSSFTPVKEASVLQWTKLFPFIALICVIMAAVLYYLTHSLNIVLAATLSLLFLLIPFVYWLRNATATLYYKQSRSIITEDITYERLLYLLSWNVASYLWGKFHHITLPIWAREPMYMTWALAFQCKLEEMRYPLRSYRCLGDFFSRPLKDDMRPIHPTVPLVSPVDGTVYSCTKIGDARENLHRPIIEHVKGLNYSLKAFLGKRSNLYDQPKSSKRTSLYQCVIYLAPGDYHRIHSSADWTITRRKHFPGALLPVNPVFVKYIKGLFALNERVVVEGTWRARVETEQDYKDTGDQYFFSLTAVGAYNVGSIELNFDQQVTTNERPYRIRYYVPKYPDNPDADLEVRCPNRISTYDRIFPSGIHIQRGEELAKFKLGSTVVLIFEAPDDMALEFCVKSGQKVKVGEPLIK
jgi:phosphatidylserine decarboxylase